MAPSAVSPTIGTGTQAAALPSTPGSSASNPNFQGYDHVTWYVGNAKQTASYYVTRMGFKYVAYRGLETGSRSIASWVVSNGQATFVLTSPLRGSGFEAKDISLADKKLLMEIHEHINIHGDAVKDVAFEVDDARALYHNAIAGGAISVQEPITTYDKQDGEMVTAVIRTYGDTTHTFVERSRYHGTFMPGFRTVTVQDPVADHLPPISIEAIDHCVGNQDWDEMEPACT